MKDEKILLGKINGLFGVKGWLKVFSYTQPRHKIVEYKHWYLGDEMASPVEVEHGRAQKSGVVVKLIDIDDRDTAAAYLEKNIWVRSELLEPLPAGEYYWFQLIGLDVYDCQDNHIGKVKDLMETGANDVLIVTSEGKQEHLIPYLRDQVIKSIDLGAGRIMVDWDTQY